ncbi:class I SAM-dependent methyltransferase [Kovacikia minuta CCNUW1]|uniref:class I SAM-dependent methyltransferase n=1 Tax=Kovacikia minuta TaxID=2931930 RepID=UPI001CCF3A81|nr:class I SAM-dependent methyltransferase [Kovacikia minuta]UBF27987.1 class I SAM-dependent methyltransferase [Kovacikia minuta CCNUW1]
MINQFGVSSPYLPDSSIEQWDGEIPICKISNLTLAIQANAYYFGHPTWAKNYFSACHRDAAFADRWQAVIGNWQNKIVVDVGCGPGNLYATLGDRCGKPRRLIGVDVSLGALKMAKTLGYTPVLADAQQLPFESGFADIVMVNATLHHCDNMAKALQESARLVRPGGLLITDHDPQQSAWQYRQLGLWLWKARLPFYRWLKRGGHSTPDEQFWGLASEVHHKPGDGVTPEFYQEILEPLGFSLHIYPHNNTAGKEVLQGNYGRSIWKCRLAQQLSGINPDSPMAALSLMCVARRTA